MPVALIIFAKASWKDFICYLGKSLRAYPAFEFAFDSPSIPTTDDFES